MATVVILQRNYHRSVSVNATTCSSFASGILEEETAILMTALKDSLKPDSLIRIMTSFSSQLEIFPVEFLTLSRWFLVQDGL